MGDIQGEPNQVQGTRAHDEVEADNPISVSGIAQVQQNLTPSNQVSAAADRVRLAADRGGALYTHPHPQQIWKAGSIVTGDVTNGTLMAGIAGSSLYVTDLYAAFQSGGTITILEGNAGTLRQYFASGLGDGFEMHRVVPWKLLAGSGLHFTTDSGIVSVEASGYVAP